MDLYKLTFKSISSVTKIPDAQTIFGAICTIIKATQGDDALNNYFDSFKSEPLFVHSSMFVDGVLPMAKVGLLSISEKNKTIYSLKPEEQLNYLTQMKKLKKISFVTLEVYKKYLAKGLFEKLKQDILDSRLITDNGIISENKIYFNTAKELITHNNSETLIDEKRLYFENNIYLDPNIRFCIYVKTSNIKEVEKIFKYSPYFGFGKRISTGKNCFKCIKIKKLDNYEYENRYRILLSKCISTEFDLTESSYVIESNEYHGSNYYSSNKIGRFNCFVEGSYMKVNEEKDYYGQLVKCNNNKTIYHYGIGFVL